MLDLVRQFIHEVHEEDDRGKKNGRRFLIFPRYQQLDCVRRLVANARAQGTGQRYLIQHSAGSGKTYTIAWLAHQLSTLHDAGDRRVFDSIVVITDRRVLDRQLQAAVRQFEQTLGVVENIDKTSRQLKDALEGGKTIVVTTLQKFPFIAGEIGELPGRRFALIVDEAHSSQSGEGTQGLKSVLAVRSLEEAESEEAGDVSPEEELDNTVLAELEKRKHLPNVSTFAFTATPKPKTLELFGSKRPGGFVRAFPSLQHAPGNRGRVHPRCVGELHHLQSLLAAHQEDRDATHATTRKKRTTCSSPSWTSTRTPSDKRCSCHGRSLCRQDPRRN